MRALVRARLTVGPHTQGAEELSSDEDHKYAVQTMGEMMRDHGKAISVRMRTGNWDEQQSVALSSPTKVRRAQRKTGGR